MCVLLDQVEGKFICAKQKVIKTNKLNDRRMDAEWTLSVSVVVGERVNPVFCLIKHTLGMTVGKRSRLELCMGLVINKLFLSLLV